MFRILQALRRILSSFCCPGVTKERAPDFYVDNLNTVWIFISASINEVRHVSDIVFSYEILRRRLIKDENILIFSDHRMADQELRAYGMHGNLFHLNEFKIKISSLIAQRKVTNAFVIVTGHGSERGIESESEIPITVDGLIEPLRKCAQLQLVSLILGQCYAGIFNFVNARGSPRFCLLGATNLNRSLSALVELVPPIKKFDGSDGLRSWSANTFLYNFFSWLNQPTDIDGDGRLSALDAYRFAGVKSNERLVSLKGILSIQVDNLKAQIIKIENLLPKEADPLKVLRLKTEHQAMMTRLNEMLNQLYLHQEPWILHADLLRHTVFLR